MTKRNRDCIGTTYTKSIALDSASLPYLGRLSSEGLSHAVRHCIRAYYSFSVILSDPARTDAQKLEALFSMMPEAAAELERKRKNRIDD